MSIYSQDIEQKQVLTSIKGHYAVAHLQKMTVYNPNVDLVNNNVYTKSDRILSIHFQKPNSNVSQGS